MKQKREKPDEGSILDKMCVALSRAPAGLTRSELEEAGIKSGQRKTARSEEANENPLIERVSVKGVRELIFRLTDEGKRLYPIADAEKELYDTPEASELEPKSMPDLNIILYGPPGTGKTYDTIRRAVEICDGLIPDSREELVRRYKKLCGENRVAFVTFHQSYGYEDFVEGIRPVLEDEEPSEISEDANAIQYECRPGIFKKICSLAKSTAVKRSTASQVDLETPTIWKMSLGNTQDPDQAGIYDECLEKSYVLLGHGRGIDYSNCSSRQDIIAALQAHDSDIKPTDYHVQAIDILKNQMQDGDLVVISDGNRKFRAIARVTGNYQYLRRDSYHQMRPVEWLLELEESLPYETINSKIFSQMALYKLRKKNLKLEALQELLNTNDDSPRNHVLIIDEVNRGNISKILGELITLLEPDKRLGADNELQVTLPYSGESFGVPSNVYVIGTMNTADRSIAFLDVALRRRFRFVEMMPETELIRDLVGEDGVVAEVKVAELLEKINDRIELLFDRDHQIGHSFFLGVETLLDLRDVFCHKVIPLLQEYFHGDWEKVCLVLGCPIGTAGNATPKNQCPIITSHVLKVESLLGESDSFLEDKIRCEIDSKFATSLSESELLPYFERVMQIPGAGS